MILTLIYFTQQSLQTSLLWAQAEEALGKVVSVSLQMLQVFELDLVFLVGGRSLSLGSGSVRLKVALAMLERLRVLVAVRAL